METSPIAMLKKMVLLLTVSMIAACASTSTPPEPAEPEPVPVIIEPVVEEPVVVAPPPEPEEPALPVPTEMIQFAFDSAELSEAEMGDLKEWAAYITDSEVNTVEVHGHADEIGTEQYNQELSARRAEAAANMLRELVGSDLTVREYAHGELKPLTLDNDEQSRQQNRRVEITLPDMSNPTAINTIPTNDQGS